MRDFRESFLEDLELLAGKVGSDVGQPCDISAGPRQAGDEPLTYRVGGGGHYDGDGAGGFLYGQGCRSGSRDDDVHVETNHLFGEGRESIGAVLPKPAFDHNILTLDPAVVAKPLKESFLSGRRRRGLFIPEVGDSSSFLRWLLRLHGKAKSQDQSA